MAATEVTIQVGQSARITLTPTQAGRNVIWPGGRPQWSKDNANVIVAIDATGLAADVLGLQPGETLVKVVGGYTNGPQSAVVTAEVTVYVESPIPSPDDFAVSAVAKPIAVG